MIFSINVHENVPFLLKQLANIQEYVVEPHWIILSCNEYMYTALQDVTLPSHVIVNPEVIQKKVMHGSLTHGIYSNMKLALNRFPFSYFVVLSSRNLFYNTLTTSWLDTKQPLCSDLNVYRKKVMYSNEPYQDWHWPIFVQTDVAKYFMNKNLKLHSSAHEGMVFHHQVCKNIEQFLEQHPSIRTNTFEYPHCVEEFALQTISMNMIHLGNPYYGFIYIGHGVYTSKTIPTDPHLFVYKVIRQ